MTPEASLTPSCGSRPAWRRRLAYVLLVLSLSLSGVAEAYTLEALLRLPLERLMQLTISARRVAQAGDQALQTARVALADGSGHVR